MLLMLGISPPPPPPPPPTPKNSSYFAQKYMQYSMPYIIMFQKLKSYKLYPLEIVYLLFQGNHAELRRRNHQYKQFNSFRELQQYAEHSSDTQLQHEIRVCKVPKKLFQILISYFPLFLPPSLSLSLCRYAIATPPISYRSLNNFVSRR